MTPTTKPPPLTHSAATKTFALLQTYQASAIARKPRIIWATLYQPATAARR